MQGDVFVTYDPAKTNPDRLAEAIRKNTPYKVTAITPDSGKDDNSGKSSSRPQETAMKLVFLTRDGCVNTPKMRTNLDAALKQLRWTVKYESLDVGKLAVTDARRGYGTPTLLVNNRDLVGMPDPKAAAEPG